MTAFTPKPTMRPSPRQGRSLPRTRTATQRWARRAPSVCAPRRAFIHTGVNLLAPLYLTDSRLSLPLFKRLTRPLWPPRAPADSLCALLLSPDHPWVTRLLSGARFPRFIFFFPAGVWEPGSRHWASEWPGGHGSLHFPQCMMSPHTSVHAPITVCKDKHVCGSPLAVLIQSRVTGLPRDACSLNRCWLPVLPGHQQEGGIRRGPARTLPAHRGLMRF